jgi:hypothetical protein
LAEKGELSLDGTRLLRRIAKLLGKLFRISKQLPKKTPLRQNDHEDQMIGLNAS